MSLMIIFVRGHLSANVTVDVSSLGSVPYLRFLSCFTFVCVACGWLVRC